MIFLSLAGPFRKRTQYACCIHLTMLCNPRSFFQPPHTIEVRRRSADVG